MDLLAKYGWLALIIAMIGDLVVSGVLSLFYKEYSGKKMSISALGNPSSPVRLPFNKLRASEWRSFCSSLHSFSFAFPYLNFE